MPCLAREGFGFSGAPSIVPEVGAGPLVTPVPFLLAKSWVLRAKWFFRNQLRDNLWCLPPFLHPATGKFGHQAT